MKCILRPLSFIALFLFLSSAASFANNLEKSAEYNVDLFTMADVTCDIVEATAICSFFSQKERFKVGAVHELRKRKKTFGVDEMMYVAATGGLGLPFLLLTDSGFNLENTSVSIVGRELIERKEIKDNKVTINFNGKLFEQTSTDSSGKLKLSNLKKGVYEFILFDDLTGTSIKKSIFIK